MICWVIDDFQIIEEFVSLQLRCENSIMTIDDLIDLLNLDSDYFDKMMYI